MKALRPWVVGVLAVLWICIAGPALAQSVARAPQVDGFDVQEVPQLVPGTALHFTLYGTPGASAELHIAGVDRVLTLQEVQAGTYEGTYTIEPGDRIAPDSAVTAALSLGGQVVSAELDEPLVLGADAAPGGSVAGAVPARCNACGVVQAIHPVEVAGPSGYFGAVAGGVVGALLGGQVGHGDGKTAARILGAIGGAYAGHELERAGRKRTRYDVVVRMEDGGFQTRGYDAAPPFRIGDRVRVAQDGFLRLAEADPR